MSRSGARAGSGSYVGEMVRSVKAFGDSPALSASTIVATLPFDAAACADGPNRVSTRSTYPRGASVVNHSPIRLEMPYTLRGLGASFSVYGVDAVPSNTKSVL